MSDKSYIDWSVRTDDGILDAIGQSIKEHRLERNLSQAQVAAAAGISRSTLSLLERGEDVRLSTFIQVLRVLDLLHLWDHFQYREQLSPLAIARAQHGKRYRARPVSSSQLNEPTVDW